MFYRCSLVREKHKTGIFSAILSFGGKNLKTLPKKPITLNLKDIKPEVRIHLKVSLTLKAFSRCSAGFWYKLRIMVFEGHFATMLSLKVLQMKHCKSNVWGQLEGWTSFNYTSYFIAFLILSHVISFVFFTYTRIQSYSHLQCKSTYTGCWICHVDVCMCNKKGWLNMNWTEKDIPKKFCRLQFHSCISQILWEKIVCKRSYVYVVGLYVCKNM